MIVSLPVILSLVCHGRPKLAWQNQHWEKQLRSSGRVKSTNCHCLWHINMLPLSVLVRVFSFVSVSNLAYVPSVCKDWHQACESDELWKAICIRDLEAARLWTSLGGDALKPAVAQWKDLYIRLTQSTRFITTIDTTDDKTSVGPLTASRLLVDINDLDRNPELDFLRSALVINFTKEKRRHQRTTCNHKVVVLSSLLCKGLDKQNSFKFVQIESDTSFRRETTNPKIKEVSFRWDFDVDVDFHFGDPHSDSESSDDEVKKRIHSFTLKYSPSSQENDDHYHDENMPMTVKSLELLRAVLGTTVSLSSLAMFLAAVRPIHFHYHIMFILSPSVFPRFHQLKWCADGDSVSRIGRCKLSPF